jgi:dienelactone hydrolase
MLQPRFFILGWLPLVSLILGACSPPGQVAALPTVAAPEFTPAAAALLPTRTPLPPPSPTPGVTITSTPEPPPLSYSQALAMLQQDQSAPFELKVISTNLKDGVAIQDITYLAADPQYASANMGRIEAYIVSPSGKGPFAGVLFVHGLGQGWGNREEFLDEAVILAQQGVVSLLPAGLFPWKVPFTAIGLDDQLNAIKQVVELRRSLDLLLAQPGIDPQRIAYVGHDYGAMHGAVLSGVDKRVKAYALIAGDSNYSHWGIQYFTRPANLDAYRKALEAIDPISYLPHAAPAELYFQFGKNDNFIDVDTANQVFDAASQPKKIEWYDAAHTLNDQAVKDRVAWLMIQLDLKSAQAK